MRKATVLASMHWISWRFWCPCWLNWTKYPEVACLLKWNEQDNRLLETLGGLKHRWLDVSELHHGHFLQRSRRGATLRPRGKSLRKSSGWKINMLQRGVGVLLEADSPATLQPSHPCLITLRAIFSWRQDETWLRWTSVSSLWFSQTVQVGLTSRAARFKWVKICPPEVWFLEHLISGSVSHTPQGEVQNTPLVSWCDRVRSSCFSAGSRI